MRAIELGDRVAYSAAFLRSTGQHTGRVPFLRGTVRAVEGNAHWRLCVIDWHDGTVGRVLDANLARAGSPAMSAN